MQKKINKGDIVKVDTTSNEGVVFGKVIDIIINENDSKYKYLVEGIERYIDQYYIKLATNIDLKYSKLYNDIGFSNFNIEDNLIKLNFWKSQEDNITKIREFLNIFLYPYLKENKFSLKTVDINNYSDNKGYYHKSLHTKNSYIFIIPNDNIKIICNYSITNLALYIIAPNYYKHNLSSFFIFDFGVEYSDDEYIKKLIKSIDIIIEKFETRILSEKYYYNDILYYLRSEVEKDLKYFDIPLNYDVNNFYLNELPGYGYLYNLNKINWIKYYLFS